MTTTGVNTTHRDGVQNAPAVPAFRCTRVSFTPALSSSPSLWQPLSLPLLSPILTCSAGGHLPERGAAVGLATAMGWTALCTLLFFCSVDGEQRFDITARARWALRTQISKTAALVGGRRENRDFRQAFAACLLASRWWHRRSCAQACMPTAVARFCYSCAVFHARYAFRQRSFSHLSPPAIPVP